MSIKKRLDLIVSELGLSGRAFEKACGLANGSYSSIGDGVGADKLNKILIRFPRISADWLLVGRGEMLKTTDPEMDESASVNEQIDYHDVEFHSSENVDRLLSRMVEIVAGQQKDIARLITELEQIGKRTDRMLGIIAHERGTIYKDDSLKKTGSK
jgi:hypothetical protein